MNDSLTEYAAAEAVYGEAWRRYTQLGDKERADERCIAALVRLRQAGNTRFEVHIAAVRARLGMGTGTTQMGEGRQVSGRGSSMRGSEGRV